MKKLIRRTLLSALFLTFMMFSSMSVSAGWVTGTNGDLVYRTSAGKYLQSKWLNAVNAGLVKKSGKTYCIDQQGKKRYGLVQNGEDIYYFHRANGRMYVNRKKKVNGNTYFFGADGKMVRSMTIKIEGKLYKFDEYGKGTLAKQASVPVHDTFYSDPDVDDETLLASIIYCEAGNQPYYGQVAVGLVITNRVRSPLFPNDLREVIYANMQFEPARNGALTRALKGELGVTESCKNAAHEVLQKYVTNNYKITKANGKQKSMKNYFFFMTPAAFSRLGLISKKITLQDHVFFKTWQRG